MREIKFRVWDGERMLSPDLATMAGCALWPDGTTEKHGAIGGEWLQYTGLKDKNGTEIYEGDVLRLPTSKEESNLRPLDDDDHLQSRFVVRFGEWGEGSSNPSGEGGLRGCGWFTEHFDKPTGRWWSLPLDNYLRVIGNIYENPELVAHPAHE